MSSFSNKRTVKKMAQAFREGLAEEQDTERWDSDTEQVAEVVYGGLLSCVDDELYLQEFLP
ncbi:MAG: hypothetical protein L6427_03430, partial [Actinomycetia bacterium]|nr:hypothetical protein [Actinomycetes bacterium]